MEDKVEPKDELVSKITNSATQEEKNPTHSYYRRRMMWQACGGFGGSIMLWAFVWRRREKERIKPFDDALQSLEGNAKSF